MDDDRHENARLRLALEAAQGLAESRRLELVRLSAQLDELLRLASAQNEQLSDLRAMMRRKLDKRKKAADPDPEDDPPPSAPAGGNGRAAKASTANVVPTASPAPTRKPKARSEWKPRSKGTGRRPHPEHLDVTEQREDVCACGNCGSTELLARDTETTDRLDAAATIAKIRRDVREVVRCKKCGKTTTAEPPPLPCEKAKFTCAFLAFVVTMKFGLLVPLDRIRRHLASQGIDLAESTLVAMIDLASDLAAPIDGVHWKQLKASPCILADGTGLKVLVKGLPVAWDAYLDVFNVDKIAVYQFALTKHGDDLAALFQGFRGTVMCDAESRMNAIFEQEAVQRANCNAHPRRAFRDAEAAQPVLAKEAGKFLTKMYAHERRALADGLVGDALRDRRQAMIRPIASAFHAWLTEQNTPELLPLDPFGKAVRYYLRHFEKLTRFIDDPGVPIDNNPSERAFQDHAKLRLNALFAGSPEGGRRWAVLLGIVTTAKRHGLDVQAYLTWMFERRGTWRKRFGLTAAQLTPAAYEQMLEEQREQRAA